MGYPPGMDWAAFDRATASAPEPPTPRELTSDERTVIDRVRAVQAAVAALRAGPCVCEPGSDVADKLGALLDWGDECTASAIAAIEAQPRDEADAEECVRLGAEWGMER